MKIKIKKNASKLYLNPKYLGYYPFSRSYYNQLKMIDGKIIEVDTKYLFRNQFNTVPIKDVSKFGMRIMDYCVDKVINDKRIGMMRCQYCGKTVKWNIKKKCGHCGNIGYLEKLK